MDTGLERISNRGKALHARGSGDLFNHGVLIVRGERVSQLAGEINNLARFSSLLFLKPKIYFGSGFCSSLLGKLQIGLWLRHRRGTMNQKIDGSARSP
jgi:hypothetical protein